MRGALDAHADDVVGRINSSGAQTVEAIRAQGGSVADRLGQTSDALSPATSANVRSR